MTNMTYAQALTIAIDTVADETVKEKLTALKEQLAKRKSGTNSKKAEEVSARVEKLYAELLALDKAVTITELLANATDEEVASFTNQRASALMKKLVDEGKVEKTMEKRKAYFRAVAV